MIAKKNREKYHSTLSYIILHLVQLGSILRRSTFVLLNGSKRNFLSHHDSSRKLSLDNETIFVRNARHEALDPESDRDKV